MKNKFNEIKVKLINSVKFNKIAIISSKVE